jgi:outer membrane protein assembly factor BamB
MRWGSAAAGALALALVGCQSVGNVYDRWFGQQPAVKPASLPPLEARVQPRLLWQASVGAAERSLFFPAVSGSTVYAASAAGQIIGLDALTGKAVVRIGSGRRLAGGVGASDALVLVGTSRGEVLAFDTGGQPLWTAQLSGEVLVPPEIDGSVVVVRSGNGRIYGLDVRDGGRRWVYQRTAPALSLRHYSSMTVERGTVFAGLPGGRLVSLSAATGTVAWDSVVALPRGATELERVADVVGPPVVDGERVCAVAYQGRAACFDVQSGTTIWARDASSTSGMASDHRSVYYTDEKSAVVALDKANGASLWRQDRLTGRSLSAPTAFGRYIIAGDFEGHVHLLSREDGALVGRIATDGSAIGVPPVALDERSFLVQTRSGGLFAISIE